MRLEFAAVDGGFEDEDALICGVYGNDEAGTEHYVNFQRGIEGEDPSEDWGVHCEFDDQINGKYNCVRHCRLTRTSLDVDLSEPIDWEKKYTAVSVDLSKLDESTFAAIRGGLPRIFRGLNEALEVV